MHYYYHVSPALAYTHRYHSSEKSSLKCVYWDGELKAIDCFIARHLKECQNNVICNAFQLRTVEFDDSETDEPSPSNYSKLASPRKHPTHS